MTTPSVPVNRPVGWWLKRADAAIDAAFEAAFAGTGLDRRNWQVLSTVRTGGTSEADLVAALTDFGPADDVRAVVAGLRADGLVDESGGVLSLTADGAALAADLAGRVARVRRLVAAALPGEDYPTLIGLLSRLADAVES